MFYFLLIVGAIAAVVTYSIISRAIRNAKIPKFVKKIRNVKGAIHSRKTISDADIYPPFETAMAKELGDKWEMLGLDLKEILGVGVTKAKKMPKEPANIKKDEGGAV